MLTAALALVNEYREKETEAAGLMRSRGAGLPADVSADIQERLYFHKMIILKSLKTLVENASPSDAEQIKAIIEGLSSQL